MIPTPTSNALRSVSGGKDRPGKTNGHSRHVMHLIHGLEVGGAEKLLLEFARHMDPARFALSFVSLGHDGPVGQSLCDAGYPVTALGCPAGLRPGLVGRLVRCFRRERVDLLHTHDDRAHVYGTLAARICGIGRVVHTRHGRSEGLTWRQRLLVSFLARWTDHFVCVSHDGARSAIRQGVPAHRVSTIWNGIDLDRFRYGAPPFDGPVVTVARLSPEKNLDILIQAAAAARRCKTPLQLEIAGDGPCRAELEALASRLGVRDHVRFLGHVDDVSGLLSRAGLFVLPSKTEGTPLTLLEAQACGVPVIATRVGGNPEIVEEAKTGVLIPPGDPEALADAILRLRRNPELCRGLAEEALSRVRKLFDVRTMIARYEMLYE